MNIQKLRSIHVLRELPEAELRLLSSLLREESHSKNAQILTTGTPGDSMMFLLRGKLRVAVRATEIRDPENKELVVAHLSQGDFVGELSLLTGEDRSADVSALEDSVLLVLSRKDFLESSPNLHQFSLALLRELAMRLRRSTLKLGELALYDVYRRVAATLRGISAKREVEDTRVFIIEQRPTHQELASMVGTSREMVTRALKGLEEDGHIKIVGKRVELYSLPL